MDASATTFHLPDLTVSTDSVIWDYLAEGQILTEALSVPPEKFEDKDTDTLTDRMQPISEGLEELGVDATREAVIHILVAKNVEATIGEDAEIVRSEWTDEEESYIQQLAPFFETDPWINRVSPTRMCRRVDPDFEFGQAAYKTYKLVNVTRWTDVVVVGSGVCGLAAAVAAAEEGCSVTTLL
jgi:hypothetical protein